MEFDVIKDGEPQHISYSWPLSVSSFYSNKSKRYLARKYYLNKKSKFYKKMDVSIFPGLEGLDKMFGTNFVLDYENNKLNAKIKYDLGKIFSSSKLELKEKLAQYKVAMG